MVNKKMTLDQVKARKPAMEYDGEYGRAAGRSSDQFVEAVYSRSGLQRAQADGRSSLIVCRSGAVLTEAKGSLPLCPP